MVDFLKFMLKCIWYGSGYVISAGSSSGPHRPFDTLGIIGFGIWTLFLIILSISVVKIKSLYLNLLVSMLLAFVMTVPYFLIAYWFVK